MTTFTPGETKSHSFADIHSPVSGAYLLQSRVPNVKVGEAVKRGDILIYNKGFFVPDPLTKQVSFKHGVTATVALMEKSTNHEDACEISKPIAARLKMNPAHQREIVTKNDAVILKIAKVGDHVEATDTLCIISDDASIQSTLEQDIDNLDLFEKLNRQTPIADYTGEITKIRILYGCERERLSESLKTILKTYERTVRDQFRAMNNDPSVAPPDKPGWVAPGTKYKGVDFDKSTVILEFMIEEELGMDAGDKAVIGLSSKTIVSQVSEEQPFSESGVPVDVLFSTTGVMNRIVSSPYAIGLVERSFEELKKQAVAMYFED